MGSSWTQAEPTIGMSGSTSTTSAVKDVRRNVEAGSITSVGESAVSAPTGSPPPGTRTVAPPAGNWGDDLALALMGAGFGWLAALLDPLTRAGGSHGGTPVGDAALPHAAGEGRLVLAFPSAPDRLPAAELAELFTCLDGIWAVASAIATPPEVSRSGRRPEQKLAAREGHNEPATLTVRYGSLLQVLFAGGVGAAITTALTLALKADDVILALGSLAVRLEEKRAEARAKTATHKAAQAEAELKSLRYTLQAGALAADSETYRLLSSAVESEHDRALQTVILSGNFASGVAADDVPSNPAELLARSQQYRDR